MAINNPLTSLPASIRDACVLAVIPAVGSLRDWSTTGAAVSVVGSPYWQVYKNKYGVFNPTSSYLSVASASAHNVSAISSFWSCSPLVYTAGNRGVIRWGNDGTWYVTSSTAMRFGQGGATSSASIPNLIGSTSLAFTCSSSGTPVFYNNGVFASNGANPVGAFLFTSPAIVLGSGITANTEIESQYSSVLQFNRVLTSQEIAIVHDWSEKLQTPQNVWPGMGAGLLSRPSRVPFGSQRKPPVVEEGAELVTDGDMELAGTAAWNVIGGSLTKVPGSPGGSGSQVAHLEGANGNYFRQFVLEVGKRYRYRGLGRSDGAVEPRVLSTGLVWNGVADTAWQRFDRSFVANQNNVRYYLDSGVGPGWVEFDDVSVVETNQLLSDPDMEETGTGAWTADFSASLSKVAGARTGGLGSWILRVTSPGPNASARQLPGIVVGRTYRVRGWARTGGSGAAQVRYDAGATAAWAGTTGTTVWERFDVEFTPTVGSQFHLFFFGTGYAEFDDVELIPVEEAIAAYDLGDLNSGTVIDRTGNGNNGTAVGGVQVVDTPIGKAARFDARAYAHGPSVGSNLNGVSIETVFAANPALSGALPAIVGNVNAGLNRFFITLDGSDKIRAQFYDGSFVVKVADDAVVGGVFYHVVGTWDGSSVRLYVNGVEQTTSSAGSSIPGGVGVHVAGEIDRNTAFDFDGIVQFAQIYNHALNEDEIAGRYKKYAHILTNEVFSDNWRVSLANEGGGIGERISDTPFRCGDEVGRWKVIDATINYQPVRALECQTAGYLYAPGKYAYGTWDFDLYSNGGITIMQFVSDDIAIYSSADSDCYIFFFASDDMQLRRFTGAAGFTLWNTTGDVAPSNVWYQLRITRSVAGEFTTYIKGGSYTTWTKFTPSSGTNPVTDTTFTSSKYLVLDLDAGDRITNIRHYNGVIDPTK